MSPGPIFTAMFLVSTCMLLVLGRGQLDIHWNASYLIIIACIVAVVGDCFSRLIIRVGEPTEKVQLTFNPNGGNFSDSQSTKVVKVPKGSNVIDHLLSGEELPAKEGYHLHIGHITQHKLQLKKQTVI